MDVVSVDMQPWMLSLLQIPCEKSPTVMKYIEFSNFDTNTI